MPMTNVEKLKHAYQLYNDTSGADVSAWLELMDDDTLIRSLADGAAGMEFSAERRGKAAAAAYLAAIGQDWEMLFFKPKEVIAEGDRVAMFGRCGWRHRGTGKEVESPVAAFWKFRGGKAVEYLEFYDTARAIAAAQPDGALAAR
jgi:ketosteroid isomerase-like protein